MKKLSLLCFGLSIALLSCFDSSQNIADVKPLSIDKVKKTYQSKISQLDPVFSLVSNIEEFKDYQKNLLLNLDDMTLIDFNDNSKNPSKSILIPIKDNSASQNYQKNLLISFKSDFNNYSFLIIEREGKLDNENKFSGINRIKTTDNEVLIEEIISGNRISKVLSYNVVGSKKGRNARQNSCTYEEWNFYYQKIKSNCSSDAACDIACTATGPICAAGMALQAFDYCWAFDYNP